MAFWCIFFMRVLMWFLGMFRLVSCSIECSWIAPLTPAVIVMRGLVFHPLALAQFEFESPCTTFRASHCYVPRTQRTKVECEITLSNKGILIHYQHVKSYAIILCRWEKYTKKSTGVIDYKCSNDVGKFLGGTGQLLRTRMLCRNIWIPCIVWIACVWMYK